MARIYQLFLRDSGLNAVHRLLVLFNTRLSRINLLVPLFIFAFSSANAGSFVDNFIDPEDGWLDGGKFLLDYPYGVLPVPIFITEPAVGTGFGLAGVHFHDAGNDVNGDEKDSRGRTIPRSISALALGATENGTKFAGGGHLGHYKQGTIRYKAALGYADVFMDFYGTVEKPADNGLSFNTEATALLQALTLRLGQSNWFAGGAYKFISAESRFKLGNDVPGVSTDSLSSNNAAIAAVLQYDSLNNQFTPKSGIISDLQLARFDEAVGGDFDYNQIAWLNQLHTSFAENWRLGLRLDGNHVDGDAPFYAIPFIKLEGIPALRYQGKKVVTSEARLGWEFHPRWQVGVFAGAGRTANEEGSLSDAPSRVSRGVGFRYMILKRLGLNIGLDYAKGPEDSVVYIKFGSRWWY